METKIINSQLQILNTEFHYKVYSIEWVEPGAVRTKLLTLEQLWQRVRDMTYLPYLSLSTSMTIRIEKQLP